jgi:hypothetical protein
MFLEILEKKRNFVTVLPFEVIEFKIGSLTLQEPMALITNWLIAAFCFYTVLNIKWTGTYSVKSFRLFYLYLGISTFFGGLGHLFFQYTGIFGKYPSWILAVVAGYYIGRGVLYYWRDRKSYNYFNYFLLIKSVTLLLFSLLTQKFVFVAIDSILTYILYAGYLSLRLWLHKKDEMQYFFYGMLILFPSAFIFLMNINIHRYLNRDDLSHILILGCIISFYIAVKRINQGYSMKSYRAH